MNLNEWVKAARQHSGLTQEAAGARLGVTKANWSAWENARHKPSFEQIAQIAASLGFPMPMDAGQESPSSTLRGFEQKATTSTPDVSSFVTKEAAVSRTSQLETLYAGQVTYSHRVPVTGTARLLDDGCYEEIGQMGDVAGFVLLQTQDPGAHALRIRGDQMAPAIRDGWFVVVSPNSQPQVGEYVQIKLKTGQRMVRELLYQREDSIAVMTVNGATRATITAGEIESVMAVAAVIPPSQWRAI